MTRFTKICTALLMSMVLLASLGCTAAPRVQPATPDQVTDQLGRLVAVKEVPQRIISLAPSNTEILFALGLGDRIVAVTKNETYPPEAKQKDTIGGFSTPNIEKILSLSPDLVVAAGLHEKTVIPRLEENGIKVVALNSNTIDDTLKGIILIGNVTGKSREAATLVAQMNTRIKAVTDKTTKLPESGQPSVLYIVWSDPLKVAGSGTFHDDLIRKAGGRNVSGTLSGYPTVSLESVIQANPAVMIAGVGHGNGLDAPMLFAQNEPRLRDTSARQLGLVYGADADIAGRAGPRIVDALEEFARFIHPELFGEKK